MPTINALLKNIRCKKYHCNAVRILNAKPQRKGVCIKVRIMKPKKPNSAQRKIVKVKLTKRRNILAYIPGQGHTLKSFFSVLIQGGRANDLPGLRVSLIRGKYDFNSKEKFWRTQKRSKYGLSKSLIFNESENEETEDEI